MNPSPHLCSSYGIKPLYVSQQSNIFAFGSEQKAILARPDYTRKLDRLFHQAVKRQLVTDVELGSYLSGGINILVDCGITHGQDPQVPFDRFPVPPADIDFLFLTHAHIDHTGRVPDLIDTGFSGEIIRFLLAALLPIPFVIARPNYEIQS